MYVILMIACSISVEGNTLNFYFEYKYIYSIYMLGNIWYSFSQYISYIVPFSDKTLNNSLLKYRCASADLNSALFLVEKIFCNIFLCTGMLLWCIGIQECYITLYFWNVLPNYLWYDFNIITIFVLLWIN